MDALHLDEITLIEKAWVGNMAAEISVAQQYTGLGLLIFIGLGFPIAAFTLSRFFRPRRPITHKIVFYGRLRSRP